MNSQSMVRRIASNLVALFDLYLQECFPPILDKRVDATSMNYFERINRKGVFRTLDEVAGVTIVKVTQGPKAPELQPGTRASRTQFDNYLAQLRHAEEWGCKVDALAAKHGAARVHDEIMFSNDEQRERFFEDLAQLA